MVTLTNQQARKFLLLKHGLLGSYRFSGKEGALDFGRQSKTMMAALEAGIL